MKTANKDPRSIGDHCSGNRTQNSSDGLSSSSSDTGHVDPLIVVAPAEQDDPLENSIAYRRCLGQFATGVTVVTARSGDKLVAMTANSFSSVSLSPPLVLWSVKRTSQSFEAFRDAPHFAINILATDQLALSRHFGKSGDDKFTSIPWSSGISGAPMLHGVAASIECRRVLEYDGGDHLIILGHVERFTRYDRDVLLFVQGRYGVVRDHPELAAKLDPDADVLNAQGPTNEFMAGLMYRAYGALSTVMTRTQRKEGFDPAQGRILGAIASYPNRTVDMLMPELYLGATVTENSISELISNGLVLMSARGELSLSDQGQARLKRLTDAIRLREAEQLDGLTNDDIAAARRVFRHLISQGRATQSHS